jgi:hypothetical protein
MIAKNQSWPSDKLKFMEQALIIDTLRGDDSTGVFYKRRSTDKDPELGLGNAGWCKSVAAGYEFVNSKDYLTAAKDMNDYWFMVGHNRASTVGESVVQNAHPFQEGPITMVHNGTLRSTYHLPKSQTVLGVDVDSHALCHNLALVEPEDAHEVFTIIDGAFTLVWHDARDGSLNFIRNSERPLHMATTMCGNVLYFASEAGQLQWLNDRLKLNIDDIVYPQPGLHLKFHQGDLEPVAVKHTLSPKYHYAGGYQRGSGGYDRAYQQWWEDEEESGWTSNGVAIGSPKMQPPQDNRVLVGGRRREIPQLSQEMLLKEDLVIEDRILFTPIARHIRAGSHGFVVGTLDSLGMTAVIHKVESHTMSHGFDRRWLVRPVALKYADAQTPIIVCKLESSVGHAADERIAATETPTGTPSTDELPDVYPAGDNLWVGKQEWLELTAEGCTFCDAVLHLQEAMEMRWIDDEMPLCPRCGEDQHLIDEHGRDLPWYGD